MFNYQRFFFSTKRQIEALYGIYEVDEKVDLISGLKKSTFLGSISLNICVLHKSNSR